MAVATDKRGPARSGLDVMLTDAASNGGTRLLKPGTALGLGLGLARRPQRVVKRGAGLVGELAKVAAGRSELAPAKRDRRFADDGWTGNWALQRVLQTHIALEHTVDGLVGDAELDWRRERQARFAVTNVMDAIAPSNNPLINPTVLKATVDEGGANFVRGARRFVRDFPGSPATVDTSRFEVGENVAVTEGAVVHRTDVFELIQYKPRTPEVRSVPLLIAPPTINKYYILDLREDRSLVQYLLDQGQAVFMISWADPTPEQGEWDFDVYAAAIQEARDVTARISQADQVHLQGVCSGGIISGGLLGAAVKNGDIDGYASLSLLVCAIDSDRAGTADALISKEVAAAAVAESARKGYLDGKALAGVFTWLRPNDLVWNYVVNNYLMGRKPPAFDVLFWNQDTVRMTAGLHRDFIHMSLDNLLAKPGGMEVLDEDVDLSEVKLDTYVVAGVNDHIVPWENAYRSTQLFGGDTRFILSSSGHIQALVNPPDPDGKATFHVGSDNPETPEAWQRSAARHKGSWWEDYDAWLSDRSGPTKPAPRTLGRGKHKRLDPAPGPYVRGN